MSTEVPERDIAHALREHGELGANELEDLLSAILATCAGYRPRALDGLLVSKQARIDSIVEVRAIAILIDEQSVEPAILSLALSSSCEVLSGSTVSFGTSSGKRVPYGSPAHHRVVNRLLCEPPQIEPWAHEFVRTASSWQGATVSPNPPSSGRSKACSQLLVRR